MHALPISPLFPLLLLLFTAATTAYSPLSESFLRAVPSGSDDLDPATGALLAPILRPRVPGTRSHAEVQHHFVSFFRTQLPRWSIDWQNSTAATPMLGGRQVPFSNVIFRREPPWVREGQANYLTLAAHYDSKWRPEGFVGATDSAVPCAILMHVARSLDRFLTQMHDEMAALGEGGATEMDMGVQILLLDGEEAFESWTSTDSLYGARSLAEAWETRLNPPLSFYRNPIGQISLFVLLDLLGAASPTIPTFYQTTHWAYRGLAEIERRMRDLGLLESRPAAPFLPHAAADFSASASAPGKVGDDHQPFLARGVPVLHLIPLPFPDAWHTLQDDGAHLDTATVRDWSRIMTAFAYEWLDMMEVWKEPQV